MITRPVIATFTIWLTAFTSWAGNSVSNYFTTNDKPAIVVETSIQAAESVSAQSVTVLQVSYKFNEKSPRVRELQKFLGTVRVDGQYGTITRREHLQALKAAGLPVDNVPNMAVIYNISYNPAERCPQFEDEFRAAGLEPVDVFSYIAYRESHCNPDSQNATWKNGKMTYHLNKDGSYDTGLLQINSSWQTVTENVCGKQASDNHMQGLKDANCNIAVAKYIMDNSKGKLANWRVYKVS